MSYLFNSKFNDQNRNKKYEYKNIFTMENKLKPRKNLLYVRKIKDSEKSLGDIGKQIYDSFNDPSQYFIPGSPIHVGKNIEIKTFESMPKRRLTRKMTKDKPKKKNSTRNDLSSNEKSYITTKTNLNKQQSQNSNLISNNFEIIDNNILKNIFESFRRDTPIKQKRNNLYSNINPINLYEKKHLPVDLSRSLDYQNKILNVKNDTDKDVKKMAHFISKKINKSEKDLMINNVDLYKYKKEVLKEIGNGSGKSFEDNYGKYIWNIGLRRPESFKGVRKLYVNVNNDYNPFWKVIVEKSPNYKELSIRPDFDLNNKEFVKFTNNKGIQNNIGKVKNLKNLDTLSIKGKNLFDVEYNREMSSKGRKILHKVFVENGKIISDQDINSVFGDATLYKNYDNKKTYEGNEETFKYNDVNRSLHKNKDGSSVVLTSPNADFCEKSIKSISRTRSNILNN